MLAQPFCAVRDSHRPEHRLRPRLHRWLPALTAVGAAGAAVAARLAYRSSATAGDWTGTWRLDVLTALCAGAVWAVMLVVLRGSGGLGHAPYAAPLTTVATVTVLWATRFGSWKHPFEAWGSVLVTSSLAGLAVVLLVLAVPAGFLPAWDSRRGAVQIAVPSLAVIVTAAAVLALQHSGDALLLR
ncbi:hypothetical protein ABZ725_30650 [Streptomyces sp. NPDC006872]|uniref:hypothetical protein n=1 Tax=Streptomyces sp. NPDC006872 TaxID=3155720 RepID=UPI0033FBBE4F